jgi:hypothetical protein
MSGVIVPETGTPKDNSVVGVGVCVGLGVGIEVGVLLSPSLLLLLEFGVGAVDCCVGVAVGGTLAATGGFVCELSPPWKILLITVLLPILI